MISSGFASVKPEVGRERKMSEERAMTAIGGAACGKQPELVDARVQARAGQAQFDFEF